MADNTDDAFVDAWSKTTGGYQRVPAEWLDHEVLGADFSTTPTAEAIAAARASEVPSDLWTIQQLRDYADEHGIDLTGAGRTKAEVFTAVTTPQVTTTEVPNHDNPGSTGEQE